MRIEIATAVISGIFAIVVALISNLILKITYKNKKAILEQMLNEVYEPLYMSMRNDMLCCSHELIVLCKEIYDRKSKFLLSSHESNIRCILSINVESLRKTKPYMEFALEFYFDISKTYNHLRRILGYPYSNIIGSQFNLSEFKGQVKKIVFPKMFTLVFSLLTTGLMILFSPAEYSVVALINIFILFAIAMFIMATTQISRLSSKQTHARKLSDRLTKLMQEANNLDKKEIN